MTVQPAYVVSSNGIQSLGEASEDYELAPVGIASMHDQMQRLAEFGRNGDIYIVHAAEGETVIPEEVLSANPEIKNLLFTQMREMGLDPEEYVVGNEFNSINPATGLPEFFFKKIFSGIKKAVKSVFKIVKKAAPIVLPIALSAFGVPFLGGAGMLPGLFGPGSFGAAALGGMAGSLAGGNSLRTSIKSGLLAGGTSALTSGIMGGFRAPEGVGFGTGFTEGVKRSLVNPYASTPTQQWGRLMKGDVGEFYDAWAPKVGEEAGSQTGSLTAGTGAGTGGSAKISPVRFDRDAAHFNPEVGFLHPGDLPQPAKGGIGEAIKPYLLPVALGVGAAGLAGAFDPVEGESIQAAINRYRTETGGTITAAELMEKYPGKYRLPPGALDPFAGPRRRGENVPPPVFVARGGDISQFPRRDFLVEGEGTERSDDIPAMLSDGEFVMNSRAVRGADPTGRGNRYAGAENLYRIMRDFEMRA